MCNVEELLKLTIFGAGIACAGSLMAEEVMPVPESANFNWMQQYKVVDSQDVNAFREEVEMRMRNMSQQERDLMRSTEFNGRNQVTSGSQTKKHDQDKDYDSFGSDSRYGRGFESRHLQEIRPEVIRGNADIVRGADVGGRQGRGR